MMVTSWIVELRTIQSQHCHCQQFTQS